MAMSDIPTLRRRAFAIAKKIAPERAAAELLHEAAGVPSLKGLTLEDWGSLVERLMAKVADADCPADCSTESWRRICWLRRDLGWSDEHLDNYIRRQLHIDRGLLHTHGARAIITGLERIRRQAKGAPRG
jgi:hypothetical protein